MLTATKPLLKVFCSILINWVEPELSPSAPSDLYQQPAGISPPPDNQDKLSPCNSSHLTPHTSHLTFVVVAGHGSINPLSQQVWSQLLWLTGNVAIAAHVAVTCEVSLRVITLGLNIQPLARSPLYLILLLIICSRGRNVEIFGLGSSSITTI